MKYFIVDANIFIDLFEEIWENSKISSFDNEIKDFEDFLEEQKQKIIILEEIFNEVYPPEKNKKDKEEKEAREAFRKILKKYLFVETREARIFLYEEVFPYIIKEIESQKHPYQKHPLLSENGNRLLTSDADISICAYAIHLQKQKETNKALVLSNEDFPPAPRSNSKAFKISNMLKLCNEKFKVKCIYEKDKIKTMRIFKWVIQGKPQA